MSNGQDWQPKELPLAIDVESKTVLKRLPKAHAALAELKGIASTIPNQGILINALGLQEAKDSSAIENIITTHDDLYKSGLNIETVKSLSAKEVQNYISALKAGFELLRIKGSHRIYAKDKQRMIIPYHAGKSLHPKIVKQVLQAIN